MIHMQYRRKAEELDDMLGVREMGGGKCGMKQDWVERMGALVPTGIGLVMKMR